MPSVPTNLTPAQNAAYMNALRYEAVIRAALDNDTQWVLKWPKIKADFMKHMNALQDNEVPGECLIDKLGPIFEKYWYLNAVPLRHEFTDIIKKFEHDAAVALNRELNIAPPPPLQPRTETDDNGEQEETPAAPVAKPAKKTRGAQGNKAGGERSGADVQEEGGGHTEKQKEKGTAQGKGKGKEKAKEAGKSGGKAKESEVEEQDDDVEPPPKRQSRKRRVVTPAVVPPSDEEDEGGVGPAAGPAADLQATGNAAVVESTETRSDTRPPTTANPVEDGENEGDESDAPLQSRRTRGRSTTKEVPPPKAAAKPVGNPVTRARSKPAGNAATEQPAGNAASEKPAKGAQRDPTPPPNMRIPMNDNPCFLCHTMGKDCYLNKAPKKAHKRACFPCTKGKIRCSFTENALLEKPATGIFEQVQKHMARFRLQGDDGVGSSTSDGPTFDLTDEAALKISLLTDENAMLRGELQSIKLQMASFFERSRAYEHDLLVRIGECVEEAVYEANEQFRRDVVDMTRREYARLRDEDQYDQFDNEPGSPVDRGGGPDDDVPGSRAPSPMDQDRQSPGPEDRNDGDQHQPAGPATPTLDEDRNGRAGTPEPHEKAATPPVSPAIAPPAAIFGNPAPSEREATVSSPLTPQPDDLPSDAEGEQPPARATRKRKTADTAPVIQAPVPKKPRAARGGKSKNSK